MAADHDTLFRVAMAFAAAAAAFAVAVVAARSVVRRRGAVVRRADAVVTGAIYWTIFLGDLAPFVWARVFHADPAASSPATAALYVAAGLAAVLAMAKGRGIAALAAAAALILRWILNITFASGYDFLVK